MTWRQAADQLRDGGFSCIAMQYARDENGMFGISIYVSASESRFCAANPDDPAGGCELATDLSELLERRGADLVGDPVPWRDLP